MMVAKLKLQSTKPRALVYAFVLGGIIGIISIYFPLVTFWSEHQIPTLATRGLPPADQLPFFDPSLLTSAIPKAPYSPIDLFVMAVLKFLSITMSVTTGYPGGIIYPLYFAGSMCAADPSDAPSGGSLGYAVGLIPGLDALVPPLIPLLCFMASIEAAVLRTPMASVLLVYSLHSTFSPNRERASSGLFPVLLTSVYIALAVSSGSKLFAVQKKRNSIVLKPGDAQTVTMSKMPAEAADEVVDTHPTAHEGGGALELFLNTSEFSRAGGRGDSPGIMSLEVDNRTTLDAADGDTRLMVLQN